MGSMNRRQFLKLSAGLSAVLLPTGCRALLERIGPSKPTPSAIPSPLGSPLPRAMVQSEAPSPLTPAAVSPVSTPTLAPYKRLKHPAGGSKLGFHAVFGSRAGLDECLWWCALSGQPVAVIKCVDDFEAAFKARRYSDKTLTVGRVNAAWLT